MDRPIPPEASGAGPLWGLTLVLAEIAQRIERPGTEGCDPALAPPELPADEDEVGATGVFRAVAEEPIFPGDDEKER